MIEVASTTGLVAAGWGDEPDTRIDAHSLVVDADGVVLETAVGVVVAVAVACSDVVIDDDDDS